MPGPPGRPPPHASPAPRMAGPGPEREGGDGGAGWALRVCVSCVSVLILLLVSVSASASACLSSPIQSLPGYPMKERTDTSSVPLSLSYSSLTERPQQCQRRGFIVRAAGVWAEGASEPWYAPRSSMSHPAAAVRLPVDVDGIIARACDGSATSVSPALCAACPGIETAGAGAGPRQAQARFAAPGSLVATACAF